ncbi:MAG TPA: formyltransferase family protein [Pyrinomonadaceae bacterium]|jgi:methionyl-tRNA formyltransferase|nr:formyltransferase family protein [Pyrinomonadaceae bacterium]
MSAMKIALFATNVVGLEVARFLGAAGEPPACLILDSQDAVGLNAQIVEGSGVKDAAAIFYSNSLAGPQTLAALRELGLDLAILAWWPYIIKPELISVPRLGCLNFHPSYLPYNRGKHYNFWALVEGAPFGVTLHWVGDAVDCGDIAFQSRIETTWADTGATLYHKAQQEIVRLFKESYPAIKSGNIPRVPQELECGSFHFARELEEASRIELDKTYTARDLLNLLRARTFPPHPAASFVADGQTYEVRVEIRKIGDEGQDD